LPLKKTGIKVRLQEEFTAFCPDMTKLIAHTKSIRYNRDIHLVIGFILLCSGIILWILIDAWKHDKLFGLSSVYALGITLFCTKISHIAYQKIVLKLIKNCIDLVVVELKKFSPDVVIGSSLGGAIAVELLRCGSWNGPTVLLAPAHLLVARITGTPERFKLPPTLQNPVHVYHGTADDTVPISDSQALVAQRTDNMVKLTTYQDDDHILSKNIFAEQLKQISLPIIKNPNRTIRTTAVHFPSATTEN